MDIDEPSDMDSTTFRRTKAAMKAGTALGKATRISRIVSFVVLLFFFDVNTEYFGMVAIVTLSIHGLLWMVDRWILDRDSM